MVAIIEFVMVDMNIKLLISTYNLIESMCTLISDKLLMAIRLTSIATIIFTRPTLRK
jgi:hypothetical protein